MGEVRGGEGWDGGRGLREGVGVLRGFEMGWEGGDVDMNSFGHFLSSFVWSISFDFLEVAGRFEIYIHYFFFEG